MLSLKLNAKNLLNFKIKLNLCFVKIINFSEKIKKCQDYYISINLKIKYSKINLISKVIKEWDFYQIFNLKKRNYWHKFKI